MSSPNAELVAACVVATACIVAVAAGTSPALRLEPALHMEVEAMGVIDPSRTPVAKRPKVSFERHLTFEPLDGEKEGSLVAPSH